MKREKITAYVRNSLVSVLTLFFSLSAVSIAQKTTDYKIPDFAFPKSVELTSDSILRVALSQGDDVLALREMMNHCIAVNQVDYSNYLLRNLTFLDSIGCKLNKPYRNLAYLLEAEILKNEYFGNQYRYDSRKLPGSEIPSDPKEWNGAIFKEQIGELINRAVNDPANSRNLSIDNISILISNYSDALKARMTVNDFILFKAVKILEPFANQNQENIIPFSESQEESISQNFNTKIKSLLDKLIQRNKSNGNWLLAAFSETEYASLMTPEDRYEYTLNLLDKFKDKEGESLLLYELWNERYISNAISEAALYTLIEKWIEKNPDGFLNENLRYAKNIMAQKNITVEIPRYSLSDATINAKVNFTNMNQGYVLIYKVKNNEADIYDGLNLKNFSPSGLPVKTFEINSSKTVPFSEDLTLEISGLKPGLYVAIPSDTKKLPKGWKDLKNANYSTFRVSDISIITVSDGNEKDSGRIYVVNAKNQQPIEGATVNIYDNSKKKVKYTLKTGKDGSVVPPSGYYRIEAKYGDDFIRNDAGFSYYPYNNTASSRASILTDLSIYRPGDTVNFAVVGWIQQTTGNSLIKDTVIDLTLKDANYQDVDKIRLELDHQGRASGKFAIPEGRLLGIYRIMASYPSEPGRIAGSNQFEVSDYKLPEFIVTLQNPSEDLSLANERIEFNGSAVTFSGMPVAEAPVNITIDYLPWWGLRGGYSPASYTTNTSTDINGKFTITLPTERLKGTRFEEGRFKISARVTSASGDSQEGSMFFYLGQDFTLRPGLKDKIKISEDTLKLYVPAYNIQELPVEIEAQYKIWNVENPAISLSGTFITPNLILESDKLPSGKYKLEFRIKDSKFETTTETIIYREGEKKTPYTTSLWVPQTEYTYGPEDKAIDVEFGSAWPNSYLLCIISNPYKILKKEWVVVDNCNTKFTIDLPEKEDEIYVNLSAMHDFKLETGKITVIPKKSLEKLSVETVSFRPDLTAGDKERWSFKFKINDMAAENVAAFAVMTDKALNSLRDFRWNLNISKYSLYSKTHIGGIYAGNISSWRSFSNLTGNTVSFNFIPGWETYNYPLIYGDLRLNTRMYKSAAVNDYGISRTTSADQIFKEEAEAEETFAAAGAIADAEAPMSVDDMASSIDDSTDPEIQLRPFEMPLAFFRTDLTADSQGELNLDFIVPDFNTTWQLQLTGYNEELLNTQLSIDAVASKPVMARLNLPQYLRTGDKAEISALLYNNSSEDIPLEGKIIIENGFTGEILKSIDFSPESVKPSQSRKITVRFDTPENMMAINVKVIATGAGHSDGEQGLVKILPSSTPVTDSKTFYLTATQDSYSATLPKFKKDANVTLKYCDNPLWEVMLSLPSLKEADNQSSISMAKQLFAILTGKDILESNEEISKGLEAILVSNDSTLSESNLQKNQELKNVKLEMTPWINNANAETARIRSLSYLLDEVKVSRMENSTTTTLASLQNSDGGWSWFEDMNSSPYITSEIIGILSWLNQNNLLDNQLKEMARKGIRYYDNFLTTQKAKGQKFSTLSLLNYFYNRSGFDLEMSKTVKELANQCKEGIKEEWRHYSLSQKSMAAILLYRDKEYRHEAETIISSLAQFTEQQRSLYDLALMLEAFAATDSSETGLENTRQLLFLKKETQDWGDNPFNAAIIHSLVASTPNNLINKEQPQIFVDGKLITISSSQILTGNYTINLNPSEVSGKKIQIKRTTGIPAWGGIISQWISPIKDVKSSAVENLKIEKNIYVIDKNGKTIVPKKFQKGDKIVVSLQLTCGKDMEYVAIIDQRAACLQPDSWNSGFIFIDGLPAYREIRDDRTSFFIERLPAGKYIISYECAVDRDGEYSLGIVSAQSLYSPIQSAHSAGSVLKVNSD
ncbi:MAG: hypothetical protein J1E82_01385 [Muribaculaceae bacterium]|nr:hypothetical protein [Muribaculaceae bacterium]